MAVGREGIRAGNGDPNVNKADTSEVAAAMAASVAVAVVVAVVGDDANDEADDDGDGASEATAEITQPGDCGHVKWGSERVRPMGLTRGDAANDGPSKADVDNNQAVTDSTGRSMSS